MEHALELLLLKDQQVIEAFLPHAPHEALADRIGSGCMIRRFQYLDAASCGHVGETGPKFAIVITNEIFRCLSIGGGFSQLLGHPRIGRRACHSNVNHLARLQLENEEREEWSKEEISDLQARHMPRSVLRGC